MLTPSCKQIFFLFIGIVLLTSQGCNKDEGPATSMGTITLEGETYNTLTIRDLNVTWLAGNFKYPSGLCYDGEMSNCEEYGLLYTYSAAAFGCQKLGERWSLPSKSDWEDLVDYFGGFNSLIEGSDSGFNAKLGGAYQINITTGEPEFFDIDRSGKYWTITKMDAWSSDFYVFELNSAPNHTAFAMFGGSTNGLSCRCIREN